MKQKGIILTNNPLVRDHCDGRYTVIFLETGYEGILRAARDRIHGGDRLLIHPLYGSIKPKETPYRSVLLAGTAGAVCRDSLAMIENALMVCSAFSERDRLFSKESRGDFAKVDLALFINALG